ncbi:13613_t:CDS:2 [Funneliformis geosporum]|uniref:13613_t:CDS:1 n=1 Tax=Funneliformis geosporum TaxID=1117311 RepID=A0A9W4SNE7_9GLOM|nr:13613_t:CDS:2 [Funneliformis geosporum]
MASNYCSEVIQDFENALEDSEDYDVIIKAGEYDVKELQAHSFVLRASIPNNPKASIYIREL